MDTERRRKERIRKDLEMMEKEMEVTGFAKGRNGQKVKRVPRSVAKLRAQKRRKLEKADAHEFAILGDEESSEGEDDDDNITMKGKRNLQRDFEGLKLPWKMISSRVV